MPIATGGTNKINVALSQGGPEGMVATVENLTGVTFDYYVLTGFDGMTRIFDALGGLHIDVPYSFEGYEGTNFTEGRTVDDRRGVARVLADAQVASRTATSTGR